MAAAGIADKSAQDPTFESALAELEKIVADMESGKLSLERTLAAPTGARLLDVPCGNGRHSIELAQRGFELTGLDRSREFIEEPRAASSAMEPKTLSRSTRP